MEIGRRIKGKDRPDRLLRSRRSAQKPCRWPVPRNDKIGFYLNGSFLLVCPKYFYINSRKILQPVCGTGSFIRVITPTSTTSKTTARISEGVKAPSGLRIASMMYTNTTES